MKKLSLISILIIALAAGFAQTAIPFEATYTFGADGDVTSFAYNGTQYSGISMGSIEKKYLTSVSSDGNFRAEGWPNGISSPRIVFTISAVPGYKYTVNSITFGLGRTATGATRALWRGGTSYSSKLPYTGTSLMITVSYRFPIKQVAGLVTSSLLLVLMAIRILLQNANLDCLCTVPQGKLVWKVRSP